KKDEFEAAILELQEDYEASVEHAAMLEDRQALLNEDIAALEAANKELEEEDARILQAILEAEAEAERKRKEAEAEAERKRQESAAAAAKTTTTPKPVYNTPTTTTVKNQNNNTNNGGGQAVQTTQDPVQTQAPVYTTTKATTTTQAPAVSAGRFIWPCPGFYVLTSGFGPRWGRHHSGIDISSGGISGATVVCSLSGTVTKVNTGCSHNYAKSSSCGCGGGYGNYVLVTHANGYSTMYAHLSSVSVYAGQSVSANTVLGYVGSTGFSTGPHLHYEVRLNGARVDPELYLY
ncbi:MAG: M23 family metallopeptidase, partial [Oscillospiraceae bacterium]|nr:M23 family metallopeptidase [Oscillospiraceae bacterium]